MRSIGISSVLLVVGCGSSADIDSVNVAQGELECRVAIEQGRGELAESWTFTYRYDEAARRLTAASYTYDLDELGRVWKVYGNNADGSLDWYWTETYDERGNLASNEHRSGGVRTHENTYDGGRLFQTDAEGQGAPAARTTYYYEDPSVPGSWTKATSCWMGRSIRSSSVVSPPASSPAAVRGASGEVWQRWVHGYDGDAIAWVERDWSYWESVADGTPDVRFSGSATVRRSRGSRRTARTGSTIRTSTASPTTARATRPPARRCSRRSPGSRTSPVRTASLHASVGLEGRRSDLPRARSRPTTHREPT